jgi:dihydroneopterin aldolase
MRFHALVGILPHELTTPQPIEIDLRARVSAPGAIIDYRALYAATARVIQHGHIEYLEVLAGHVARAALGHSSMISSVRVAVRKPHVALPGPLSYAEVVIEEARA